MEYVEHLALLIAIVETLKLVGVKGNWSAIAGVVLGVAFSLAMDFAPEAMVHVIRALRLGLAVPGFYMIGKRAGVALTDSIKA